MKKLRNIILTLAATCLIGNAADFRIWTSKSGTNIEAQLLKLDGDSVSLSTKEPKQISIKVKDLSLADRQYLVDFAEADPKTLFKSDKSIPEKEWKKPKPFIKKLEKKLNLMGGSDGGFDLYETEHFLFAAAKGVKVKGIAETAEACWHGMAFQHFEFRENFGTTRQLVVLPENEAQYKALGKISIKTLSALGNKEGAASMRKTWNRTGANNLYLPAETNEKYNLKMGGDVFNTKDKKKYRKPWDSFQTHVISSTLYGIQAGGVSSISGTGYFALSTGHAYYKEIQLTRKTETNLISSDYGGDIATKSGFADGTAWAKLLRKKVKKGDIKLNLLAILGLKGADELTPENLVSTYSLSCYMQSTQERIAAYAKLTRLINTSDQIPAPSEFVKIFGFKSVDEFEKSWIEFVKSKEFK